MLSAPHQSYSGDQIKKNEMSGECGIYEGQKFVQGFGGEI